MKYAIEHGITTSVDSLDQLQLYGELNPGGQVAIRFNPGVRFYFKYEDLLSHPNSICDGVLPMKVKDEIILSEWVYKIVIPEKLKTSLEEYIPSNLKNRVIYIENDCKDIWDWSEKVYRIIEESAE